MDTQKVTYDLAPLDQTYPTLQVCAICLAKAKFATIARKPTTDKYGGTGMWWGIADYVCSSEECYTLWILQQ
jgi:hypothetical protein